MRQTACFIPALFWLSCAATGAKPATAPEDSAPAATPASPAPTATTSSPTASAHGSAASLPDPDWLPSEAREMLSARMDRHGEEMMFLFMSVMTLNHADSELLAEQVAAEPQLGRPSPGEKGTISALLPARFFTLQEQLVQRAHAVAAAARSNDNGRIVRAYGQLAETCVSCHSVYLNPDSVFELPDAD
jgi:hypothetical protein